MVNQERGGAQVVTRPASPARGSVQRGNRLHLGHGIRASCQRGRIPGQNGADVVELVVEGGRTLDAPLPLARRVPDDECNSVGRPVRHKRPNTCYTMCER